MDSYIFKSKIVMVLLTYLLTILMYAFYMCMACKNNAWYAWVPVGGLLIKLDSANFTECHRLN